MRVIKIIIGAAAAVTSLPAAAQLNPAAIGLGTVMPAAINAQMHGSQGGGGVSEDTKREVRAGCAAVPTYRRQYGSNNSELRLLVSRCRRLGYSTGD